MFQKVPGYKGNFIMLLEIPYLSPKIDSPCGCKYYPKLYTLYKAINKENTFIVHIIMIKDWS